jgi:hypothetical protein
MWGRRRKKVKRERPRNRFLFFFPFGKMLIVILSRRVHLSSAVARSFPHITADSENSRDIQ